MSHVSSLRSVLGDAVQRWARDSQQAARRNAMVASTALAARRREHADVEDFLAARAPRTDDGTEPVREVGHRR